MGRQTPLQAVQEPLDSAPRRRTGCWCMMVVLMLLAVCGGGLGVLVLYLGGEPNAIRVEVAAPQTVALNETFTLEVTVENVSVDAVTVNGIGLEMSLLDGAEVVGVQPLQSAIRDRNYPFLGDWREYTFDSPVADGGKLVVSFTLKATAPGTYSGDVTAWIKSDVFGLSLARARRFPLEFTVQQAG